MNEKGGFITISRKLFEHELFLEHREYSRFEAWLDLIQICAFEEENSMAFRGRIIKWGRGQTVASVRYLQQRWGWKSTKKVICFLELLRSQQMVETDTSQGLKRITLCKYDSYNRKGNAKETPKETERKQRGNKLKEDKELKENREARAKFFYESLVPFVNKYGKEMLRAFYNHWSEWNQPGTKMKWELQETWEVSKRLVTWASRDTQFNRKGSADADPESVSKTKIKIK